LTSRLIRVSISPPHSPSTVTVIKGRRRRHIANAGQTQ
jgi:hypothetical protein